MRSWSNSCAASPPDRRAGADRGRDRHGQGTRGARHPLWRHARRDGRSCRSTAARCPTTLIESELFGHERGAFTDARKARRGLVAEANGGTLFLDEVDALSPKAQVTLLRFLQDQRYRPVGTARELCSDVRVVAAANRPLQGLVDADGFRADLMYRLKILLSAAAAAARPAGDIELLALHFVAVQREVRHCATKTLHPATLPWLRAKPGPAMCASSKAGSTASS